MPSTAPPDTLISRQSALAAWAVATSFFAPFDYATPRAPFDCTAPRAPFDYATPRAPFDCTAHRAL